MLESINVSVQCVHSSRSVRGREMRRGTSQGNMGEGKGSSYSLDGDEQHVTCNSSPDPHHKALLITYWWQEPLPLSVKIA